ncbi:redox-sensing transcriptional repressor Rex [Saccharicrinis sp. FJH54]|uniref:redox-sensing transcriptional repressor Rex n=1 Tax=Saccharicrinis sp. FJH54 TaxID=3344665 RepID=UPI0035D41BEE
MIGKVPEPTIRRLPFYLAHIKLLSNSGQQFISSTQLAKDIGVDSSQVAKDLSFIDITGKTRVGYEIKPLIEVLENFLGFSLKHKAYLFGAGSLGSALLQDTGLRQFGLYLTAAFDVNPDIVGTTVNGVPIRHVDEYFEVRKKTGVEIGILTVPAEKAQEVADFMIEGGIRGIWNFTPVKIKVPKKAVVQNTSLYAHLALIFNKLIHGDNY